MAKIKDYHESEPKRASATYTWVWELTTIEWNKSLYDFCEKRVAFFFDPWKAVSYGRANYDGNFRIELGMMSTRYLTDEKGVK